MFKTGAHTVFQVFSGNGKAIRGTDNSDINVHPCMTISWNCVKLLSCVKLCKDMVSVRFKPKEHDAL